MHIFVVEIFSLNLNQGLDAIILQQQLCWMFKMLFLIRCGQRFCNRSNIFGYIVNNEILINKLANYGIKGNELNWFKS